MDNEQLELWQQKKNLVEEMLTLTQNAAFSGLEEDADVYAELINQRQGLIDKFAELDNQLKQEKYQSLSPSFKIEIENIQTDLKNMYQEIKTIDDANAPIIEGVIGRIKNEFKKIKVGTNARNLYNQEMPSSYRKINIKQ